MNFSAANMLFALVSFVIAFGAARALSRWLKRRKASKDEQEVARTQSRQVRRARERKGSR
jgi:flagellar biosynthesis/type III secretory pathway M-ring protein FliF/YscJ